jgi:ethanolamine utilization protein EutA (predicted chaperonin)
MCVHYVLYQHHKVLTNTIRGARAPQYQFIRSKQIWYQQFTFSPIVYHKASSLVTLIV